MDLMIYGVKYDGKGGGTMVRLLDGLIDIYIDGLVTEDNSVDAEIDEYVHGVYV